MKSNPRAAHVVGIDLGGTKVLAGIANLAGEILVEVEVPTSKEGGTALLRQLAEISRTLARRAEVPWETVRLVCVGSPGVAGGDGTMDHASNVVGLGSTQLAGHLTRTLATSVTVENDVNMAAFGELREGVARECHTFALLAIGTGVGLGLVVDGRLVRGARGAAGEIGFFPIGGDPLTADAKRRGAFELAVSGSGIELMLRTALERGGISPLLDPTCSAREVFAAATMGDRIGISVVQELSAVLAHALLALVSLVDPEMIVIGGGIGSNSYLLEPLRAAIDRIAPWPVHIETAALGARAGLVGAVHHALLTLPQIESHRISDRLKETT